MVPTSLIMVIAIAALGVGWASYFLGFPKRLILSVKFLMMGGPAAVMVVTVILAIMDVRIIWLSWVLLAIAILWLGAAIPHYRASLAANKAHHRQIAERKAQGVTGANHFHPGTTA